MTTIIRVSAAVLLLVAATGGTAKPLNPNFRDPLKTPAAQSRLAGDSPLISEALAGKRIVAVGHRGIIVYSDDGGTSWTQASVPVSTDLTSVYFVSSRQGWAVGQQGVILHSSDGGQTWSLQMNGWQLAKRLTSYYASRVNQDSSRLLKKTQHNAKALAAQAPAIALLSVWFKNSNTGYVVGQFGVVLKTTDGGKSWIPRGARVHTQHKFHLYAVRGHGNALYIAGEAGTLLRFDRANQTFLPVKTPNRGSYFGVFVSDDVIAIYGLRGHAYYSRDKGKTWHSANLPTQDAITGMALDDHKVVFVSKDGDVFLSANNKQWQFKKIVSNHARPIYDVAFVDRRHIALVGATGLWVHDVQGSK